MRVTYDAEADAAYVYLVEKVGRAEVATTRVADIGMPEASLNVDFDVSGRVLGIEVLGAGRVLHENTIRAAEDVTRGE